MSESKQPSPSAKPAKPRSPVERMVVWGGICILLVMVAIEFTSRQAQSQALASLAKQIRAIEEPENDPQQEFIEHIGVKAADVKLAVGNRVPVVEDVAGRHLTNGGKRLEVYSWFTLSPVRKREMYVYYGAGDDADVVSVSSEPETESFTSLYTGPTAEQRDELRSKVAASTNADPAGVKPAAEAGPAETGAAAPPAQGDK